MNNRFIYTLIFIFNSLGNQLKATYLHYESNQLTVEKSLYQSTFSIKNLPRELIYEIFSFLDLKANFNKIDLLKVNKQFYDSIIEAPKKFEIKIGRVINNKNDFIQFLNYKKKGRIFSSIYWLHFGKNFNPTKDQIKELIETNTTPIRSITFAHRNTVSQHTIENLKDISTLEVVYLKWIWGASNTLLQSIAKCSNLRELNLSYCEQISDFTPLSALTNLQELGLAGTKISNLSCLKKILGLRKLDLYYCRRISDFTPLSTLTNLQTLNLDLTLISDLSCLKNLLALELLHLSYCEQISDFNPLSALTNLQELGLGGTKISDLSCLKNIFGLKKLDLSHCEQISDFNPLSALTNLQILDLGLTLISDLSCLKNILSLKKLDLVCCKQIYDFTPLSALTNLQELDLGDTQISNLSYLTDLPALKKLSLYQCDNISRNNIKKLQKRNPKLKIDHNRYFILEILESFSDLLSALTNIFS